MNSALRDRPEQQQASFDIEVTPEMIEAGVFELRERAFGEALDAIVLDVFISMWSAHRVGDKELDSVRIDSM